MRDWVDTNVLITGGMGFIGSNLAHELVDRGANVVVYDAGLPDTGYNPANIDGIRDRIDVIQADVRDHESLKPRVQKADIVYHAAAQLSRHAANADPRRDIDINCKGIINVLDSAAAGSDPPHVYFMSSLAVHGSPSRVPIDETVPMEPIDIYGANKCAGELYCNVYQLIEDVPSTSIRLANVYGPRAPVAELGYGVQYQFIALALRDEPLTVFEPGLTKRDFIHVSDVVSALIALGSVEAGEGEVYTLGSGRPTSLKELAETVVGIAGSGNVEVVPWPDDWDAIRRGDVYTEPIKISDEIGWQPDYDLPDGLRETISFYRKHRESYFPAEAD